MTTGRKTFSLGEHFEGFIEAQIADGRYDNQSEVVRAGLRLLEDHEAKMKALREDIAAADAQIAAGEGIEITDPKAFADDIIKRGRERLNLKP